MSLSHLGSAQYRSTGSISPADRFRKLDPASMTESRMLRSVSAAGITAALGGFVAVMDDDVADIRNPGEGVGENEYGIPQMNAVGEQKDRTGQRKPPEGDGNNDLFAPFRCCPLNEKA